jgi:two-component system KDP operon response regulator KdpE
VSKKKILIVEDNLVIRHALNMQLRANNYETAFAPDALLAISVARKELPDLILLDLGLPGGDGFLVMERLQNIAPLACIPIIVVSARDAEGNRERALEAGAFAFFQKPAGNDVLLAAIRQALGEPVEKAQEGSQHG